MNSLPANVIAFPVADQTEELELDLELEAQPETSAEDLQLWSALTLGSLQKQLTGHEDDPRFSAARALVDNLAAQFSTADPIDIADYFLAIETLASLKGHGLDRLNELDTVDPLAA